LKLKSPFRPPAQTSRFNSQYLRYPLANHILASSLELTPTESHPCVKRGEGGTPHTPSHADSDFSRCVHSPYLTALESALTQVFILGHLKSFRIRTYEKPPGGPSASPPNSTPLSSKPSHRRITLANRRAVFLSQRCRSVAALLPRCHNPSFGVVSCFATLVTRHEPRVMPLPGGFHGIA